MVFAFSWRIIPKAIKIKTLWKSWNYQSTALTAGHCLVLLDGLDEIVDADDRRGIVQRIEDFIRRHDNHANSFVITSRIAGYRSAPLGAPFAHYTVQEMDELQ